MLNSNVHHFIVIFFAFVTLLTQCEKPFGYIRFDEQCLRTYKPIYSHVIVYSFAYQVYDMLIQIVLLQDFTPLGIQSYIHHIATIVCFMLALSGGMHMPQGTHLTMVCEVSQVFLNVRNAYFGKHATGTMPLINNILFVVSYTIFRMMFFPILIISHFKAADQWDLWNTGKYSSLPPTHERYNPNVTSRFQ